jgi:putative peptide zinc metalloprotease protein
MPSQAITWPELRSDIIVGAAGHDVSGAPSFVIHDPVQHRYLRIPASGLRMLEHWNRQDAQAIARAAEATPDEVNELREFLVRQRLAVTDPGQAAELLGEYMSGQHNLVSMAVHNYLFMRVALLDPEMLLDAVLPVARALVSRVVLGVIAMLGALGIYFAAQQWPHFLLMARDSLSAQGAMAYGLCLIVVKFFHELGHGLVARHHGCRVPVMGLAIMVMVPMLYTDTTDAWRLSSPRQRFQIAAAGIAVELAIAVLALFLWAFLPDGPARSMAFFLAVTAWVMSLAVNLSPFMRFDGYHMLSDFLSMPNLGPRSFALANTWLRQQVLGSTEPPPEVLPQALRRFLVVFAVSTWIYRLSLFLGIAWLVYTSLPKAAGLPLAVVEVYAFILKPLGKEMKDWFMTPLRTHYKRTRMALSFAVLALLLAAALLPLDRHLHLPATLAPAVEARIFPPEPTRIVELRAQPGDKVFAGQALAVLEAPQLTAEQQQAALRLSLANERLRQLADSSVDQNQRRVLERQRAATVAELQTLDARLALLVIKAPVSGVLAPIGRDLVQGQWLGAQDLLFYVRGEGALAAGLVPERQLGRLQPGAKVTFVPEDGLTPPVSGTLSDLGLRGGDGQLEAYLATANGGSVATLEDPATRRQVPDHGQLPFRAQLDGAAPDRVMRGTAIIAADPQSLLSVIFGRIVTVVLRESGF